MTDWRRRPHLRVIDGTAGSDSSPQPERASAPNPVIPFRSRVAIVSDEAPKHQSASSPDRYPGGDAA